MGNIFLFLQLVLFQHPLLAQVPIEMADMMRQNGKIYVIVAIVVFILVGMVVYLVFLDRKISRLEREMTNLEGKNKKEP